MKRTQLVVGMLVALSGAITGCGDSDEIFDLPVDDAETARGLPLLTAPLLNYKNPKVFAQEALDEANEIPESYYQDQRDVFGRLGFFPRTFDLRAVNRTQANLVAAFYSATTEEVTLIGHPTRATLVHELVHAIQDQHFDLDAIDDRATSTDEAFAKRGLVEGDASVAELRFELVEAQREPSSYVSSEGTARESSERFLSATNIPPYFVAYPAFAYPYGAAYVFRLTLPSPTASFAWEGANAKFREGGPLSTHEVLGPTDGEPVIDVGLTAIPESLGPLYDIEGVDRLGEWHTFLLFHDLLPVDQLATLTHGWRGDQLVFFRKRDLAIRPSGQGPSAVVWTTTWAHPEQASRVAGLLARRQGLAMDIAEKAVPFTSGDGEPTWIEHHGLTVTIVKNLPEAEARVMAAAALALPATTSPDRTSRVLPIHRKHAVDRRFPHSSFSSSSPTVSSSGTHSIRASALPSP